MGSYLATQNVLITNYKPVPDRKAQKGDMNITNNENGKFKLDNSVHIQVMEKLQTLDGDSSSLSTEDLNLAKSMIGQFNIEKALVHPSANVARFVFNDGTSFRVDMGINNKPALKSIQKEIANGNAEYSSGILHYLLQCITPHTVTGDEIVIKTLPEGVKTLGDVRNYYKLPEGCLRNNVTMGGGNFDNYEATAPIVIHVGALAKGLNITEDQVKALFN